MYKYDICIYIAFLHFLEVLLEFQHFIPLVPRGLKLFAVWAHKFFKALYTEEATAAHHETLHKVSAMHRRGFANWSEVNTKK